MTNATLNLNYHPENFPKIVNSDFAKLWFIDSNELPKFPSWWDVRVPLREGGEIFLVKTEVQMKLIDNLRKFGVEID